MNGAVQGVGIIAVIILLGWFLQRFRLLPDQSSTALTSFVYWAATPALLFSVVSSQDVAHIFGPAFFAAIASGIGSSLVFLALGATVFKLRRGELAMGAMSASLNNVAYIGIPIALYVLGSATHVVPVLAFQLGFFTPMYFVLAELFSPEASRSGSRLVRVIRTVVTNPLVWAAFLGGCFSVLGITPPEFLAELTSFLGQAAPPAVLVAFGASLVGQSVRIPAKTWLVVGWASFCKMLIQPTIAGVTAWAFGADGQIITAAVLMASLPTAQNAFVAAVRAGTGKEITQGTVLATTILSLPLVVLLVALLGAWGIFVPTLD